MSFVYTQLNDQTVLFQAIQFSISHLFALSLNVKQFYFDPSIEFYQVLPLRVIVDLGVMAMRRHSTFPKAVRLLNIRSGTLFGAVLHLCSWCILQLQLTGLRKQNKFWLYIRGSLNKFPDFFCMGTFIDSTHIKL